MIFRLDQNQFPLFRKKLIIRVVPMLMLPVLFVLFFQGTDLNTLLILIPVLTLTMGFSIYQSVKRQKMLWQSFELSIKDDVIERSQASYPTITLAKSDITDVVISADGTISILSKSRSNTIIISWAVERREELLEILSTLAPVKQKANTKSLILSYAGGVAGVGLFFVCLYSSTLSIVFPSGILLIGVLVWSFIEVQRNKNVDSRLKRSSYLNFILLLVIISRMYVLWTAAN